MTRFVLILLLLFSLSSPSCFSQVAADCLNAIPICTSTPINGGTNGYGTDDFNGATVSGCISQATGTIETNSAWYRFRTAESGQLGFNIGFDANEDWDYALYKTEDCSSLGAPVRCNYFDNSDMSSYIGVGEDPTGIGNIQYEDWLEVTPNEDYYLLINNYSATNSGFSIEFAGPIFVEFPNAALDCNIIDNLLGPPVVACENEVVILDATTLGAVGYEWYLDLGMGYQQIPGETGPVLSVALSAMYRVLVITASGNNVISETQVAYAPSPVTYPLMDETVCLDASAIDLAQKDSEALGDQSELDFRVTYHETLQEAVLGRNALLKTFTPSIAAQTIYVRTTSLEHGNCFDVSESFEIQGTEVPELDFETEVFICGDAPTVTIGQQIQNATYRYEWDSGQTTSQITVATQGVYTLTAINEQAGLPCVSVRSVTVVFSEAPVIADIEIAYEAYASNVIRVLVQEEGDFEYQLDQEAPQNTPVFTDIFPGVHTITVTDLNGCGLDTAEIVVVGFPKFFTPNADGVNDEWHVAGLSVLENPVITIYDRYGKLLYQLNESSSGWDGSLNGALLPEADYWFKLTYTKRDGQTTKATYINNHFSLKR